MIIDKSLEYLERAVASTVPVEYAVKMAYQAPVIEDNYNGFIVEAKLANVSIYNNDGLTPAVATYNVSLVREVDADGAQGVARSEMSPVAILNAVGQRLETLIQSIAGDGVACGVYTIAVDSGNTEVTDTLRYIFSATLSVSMMPILFDEN